MFTLYDPIDVVLIKDGNTITPEPKFSSNLTNLTALRLHVGVCFAYLQDRWGPVKVPKIRIAYREGVHTEAYAIIIGDGVGKYRSYYSAREYVTHVFEGIESVYRLQQTIGIDEI